MKVIILCAGKGLRYANNKPKGLALIGNKPILSHIMDIYSKQNYNDFILILGHKYEDIIDYYSNINHNYNIEYIQIKENTNKGGALSLVESIIKNNGYDNFFCNYCDCIADVNLSELLKIHIESDNIATITAIRPYHDFGIIVFDDKDKIIKFREKPQLNEWVNGGFMIFSKEIFDYIISPLDNLETDIFDRLVERYKIGGYKHHGFWSTINTLKDEENLNKLFNDNQVKWVK